uniref:hypothetical protein n=1 Tax=Fulvivirga sp. TaxID=1931237 RepID=UPI00404A3AC9
MKNNLLILIVVFTMSVSRLIAQDSVTAAISTITFKTQYIQIKDQINYSMVFNGLNFVTRYASQKRFENSILIYSSELSFSANSNKGIGFAAGLIPVNVFYGFKGNPSERTALICGMYFKADYDWQLYPELQSGHMFWFTSLEIGSQIILNLPQDTFGIKITLSNSLAGFNSRPKPGTESYFYSLTFSDFITNAHSNLKFGANNLFNQTDFEFEIYNPLKRFSIAYQFEYFSYFSEPRIDYLAHSLNFIIKVGKS